MTTELNGWNVAEMTKAIDDIDKQPEAGKLIWRGSVHWDAGFGLDVRPQQIEQLGEVMERHFTLRGDHPRELLGDNTGPTAIETYLAALGACMTGTFAAQATARGIELEELEVEVEGTIDLNGFFGLKSVPPGLSAVKLTFHVRSGADDAVLGEILEAARSHSPIFDTTTRPVGVDTIVTRRR